MATAIHIEIDGLFLLILSVIAWQITTSVSKQTSRVLFRYVVYGIMINLFFDIFWLLIDGKIFPGAILLNKIVNAVLLGTATMLGAIWYLYVLDSLGYNISNTKERLLMIPGMLDLVINILSIWTGWVFGITEKNIYFRGPGFGFHTVICISMLLVSFFHILFELVNPRSKADRKMVKKLLSFYFVPVAGTLLSLPYMGMPGTWTCAAVSVILIYMNDQESAILRDSLTGLNNRKTLDATFSAYAKQVSASNNLYLFMLDLDNFKMINDTLGHPVGDQALVNTAKILSKSVRGLQALVARYGGDEFIVMGFFANENETERYKEQLRADFSEWNKTHNNPYTLSISIGSSLYQSGYTLNDMIRIADENLYKEKRSRKVGR